MIPVCEPVMGEGELKNVIECLKSNWISSKGKFIDEFEEKFSSYVGAKYGVTTTSGTTAIHLALASLRISQNDEVIVPAFTMVATVFPLIYLGAKPVLVDADINTWNIDVKRIEEKITAKTKAILPVHIYGCPVDMDPLLETAGDYNLHVIEDAAEAHGAEYKKKRVGCLSDIGCFSFYANKIITTGEGGMVVTNNKEVYQRAKLLKDLAFIRERRFLHYHLGFNYRMTNIQAAIGLAQLEKIDILAQRRIENAHLYNELLRDIKGITLPPEPPEIRNAYWMYSILIDKNKFGIGAAELAQVLYEQGIETRPFFIPMHKQPVFIEMGLFKKEKYPVAEMLSKRGLNLPSASSLKKEDIEYICSTINKAKNK